METLFSGTVVTEDMRDKTEKQQKLQNFMGMSLNPTEYLSPRSHLMHGQKVQRKARGGKNVQNRAKPGQLTVGTKQGG